MKETLEKKLRIISELKPHNYALLMSEVGDLIELISMNSKCEDSGLKLNIYYNTLFMHTTDSKTVFEDIKAKAINLLNDELNLS